MKQIYTKKFFLLQQTNHLSGNQYYSKESRHRVSFTALLIIEFKIFVEILRVFNITSGSLIEL